MKSSEADGQNPAQKAAKQDHETILEAEEKEDFLSWATSHGGVGEKTANQYWEQMRLLPTFNIREDAKHEIHGRILRSDYLTSESQGKALRKYLDYQWYKEKQNYNIGDEEYSKLQVKKEEIATLLSFSEEEVGESDYDTLDGDQHFIRKRHLVEFLRRVEPRRAKFYALQYYMGARYKEVKLLTEDHYREPNANREVGGYGGVRVEEDRSKSEFSRTVQFYSEIPHKILKEQYRSNIGVWEDEDGKNWYDVIFPGIDQSKMNYRMGKKKNGKLYGVLPEIMGDRRTLHSLRHTRITELANSEDHSLEEVRRRSGHLVQETTEEKYRDNNVEDPWTLEEYCEKEDIDIWKVINHEP